MFQRNKGARDNLLSSLTINIVLSILLLTLPTSILLILIGSRTTHVQDGAVYVDINLGTLLLFSSLAAILTPYIYRPVSIIYATHLAKQWIAASATTTFRGTSYLPSTPQYLLSVGNLGTPSLTSLGKSLKYYFRRRKGGNISPVFTQSAICLAGLLFMTVMIVIGDTWIHFASTSVPDTTNKPATSQGQAGGGGEFSRVFAPPANSSQAPWRLQQGLQTFLDVNSINQVQKLNSTTVLIPRNFPIGTDIMGTTLGIEMSCELINSECTFKAASPGSSILSWDCTSVQPGASGTLSIPVNTTILPSTSSSTTGGFNLISAMGIPSLFNSSTSITVAQVFRCNGTLQNVTYSLTSGALGITNKQGIDSSPLKEVLNLDSVAGKRDLLSGIEETVAQSTIFVQGMTVTGIGGVYADGLGRMFISFLAGETIPAGSLKESPTSLPHILSRVPLAPLLFLSIITGLFLFALLFLSLRAIFASLNPPTLNGNPISIRNLHRQLTSPMAVLASTLGDSPLAMKVLFRGSEEGRVHFDILRQSSGTGVTTKEGSIGNLYSEVERTGEDEMEDSVYRGFTFEPDPSPIGTGSGRHFQVGTEGSTVSNTPRVHYPRKGSMADSSTGGYYSKGPGRRYEDGSEGYESKETESVGGSGWERFRRDRQGSGEMTEQGMDDLSDEENRVFLGMQQRQEARDSAEDLHRTPRSITTPIAMRFAAEEGPPRENRL